MTATQSLRHQRTGAKWRRRRCRDRGQTRGITQLLKQTAVPPSIRLRIPPPTSTSTTTKGCLQGNSQGNKFNPKVNGVMQVHFSERSTAPSFPTTSKPLPSTQTFGRCLLGLLTLKARSGRPPTLGSLGLREGQWCHRTQITRTRKGKWHVTREGQNRICLLNHLHKTTRTWG